MSVFTNTLDLHQALEEVAQAGAVFIRSALAEPYRQRLQREVNAMPLEPMPAEEGVARQEGDIFMVVGDDIGRYPAVKQLRDALAESVHTQGRGIEGCSAWRPNEVSVQRYPGGSLGITPHLDQKRYPCLVAVFTAEGSARFTLCRDRAGDPAAVWQAGPGSLVLLRGPGLAGLEDGRPLHMVSGPLVGQRVSVSFRMDTRI